jgi:hypothetical protein
MLLGSVGMRGLFNPSRGWPDWGRPCSVGFTYGYSHSIPTGSKIKLRTFATKTISRMCVFSRRKADLRRHVECVQLAAALLFDRQRTLRTESGSKLHALHMNELAKHILPISGDGSRGQNCDRAGNGHVLRRKRTSSARCPLAGVPEGNKYE